MKYLVSLSFRDEFGEPIILSSFRDLLVAYYYRVGNDAWTRSTDWGVDKELNVLWVRLENQDFNGEFCVNISCGANDTQEQVLTSGVQQVTWNGLPNGTVYTLTLMPIIEHSDAVSGFAPFINENGFWMIYSPDAGQFINTNVRAQAVDAGAEGVTSTEFRTFVQQTTNNFTNITNTIQTFEERIQDLEDRRITVTLSKNGEPLSVTENDEHVIDLGDFAGGSAEDLLMLEEKEKIGGELYPRGTTVTTDGAVKSTDPHYFYDVDVNWSENDGWCQVLTLSKPLTIWAESVFGSNVQHGVLFIKKVGTAYRATATDEGLADLFRVYERDGFYYLCVKATALTAPTIYSYSFETDSRCSFYPGTAIDRTQQFDPSKLHTVSHFLTDAEYADYVNISEEQYSTADTSITKYNVLVSELDFEFEHPLDGQALTLTFNALTTTSITVTDTVFTTTSNDVERGQTATLFIDENGDCVWQYSEHTATGQLVKSVSVNGGQPNFPDAAGNVDLLVQSTGEGSKWSNARVRYIGISKHYWSFKFSSDAVFYVRRIKNSTVKNSVVLYTATPEGLNVGYTQYETEVCIFQSTTDKAKAYYYYNGGSTTSPDNQTAIFTVLNGTLTFTDRYGETWSVTSSTDNVVINMNNEIDAFNAEPTKQILSGLNYAVADSSSNQNFYTNSHTAMWLHLSASKTITVSDPAIRTLTYYRTLKIHNQLTDNEIQVEIRNAQGSVLGKAIVPPSGYRIVLLSWFGNTASYSSDVLGWCVQGADGGSGSGSGGSTGSVVAYNPENQILTIDGWGYSLGNFVLTTTLSDNGDGTYVGYVFEGRQRVPFTGLLPLIQQGRVVLTTGSGRLFTAVEASASQIKMVQLEPDTTSDSLFWLSITPDENGDAAVVGREHALGGGGSQQTLDMVTVGSNSGIWSGLAQSQRRSINYTLSGQPQKNVQTSDYVISLKQEGLDGDILPHIDQYLEPLKFYTPSISVMARYLDNHVADDADITAMINEIFDNE